MATAPQPFGEAPSRVLPDYLPARMVNEFVYCPRLFFYEWVEGVFAESADTLEGSAQHKRVDKPGRGLPAPEQIGDEELKTRAITLSSEIHRLTAKMDLLEVEDGAVRPVDYKHGRPREGPNGIELWPSDRVQLAVQALILRENGYRCDEGLVYYATTKQRARVQFTDEVLTEALRAATDAWELARRGEIPLPLVDSPKCPGCSLVGICLPDEVNELGSTTADGAGQMTLFRGTAAPRKPAASEPRRLIAPRVESKPAYLNTQGLRVGRSGGVLQVKEKDSVVQELRINELCQLNLMGNIQVSTQAVQSLCEAGVPLCYFSQGGWFYAITSGLCTKNVFLRKAQFRLADEEWFCRRLARQLTAGKIRNQRTMLLRNHIEPDGLVLSQMKEMAERADECERLDELLGIEGNAARLYFSNFSGMIKVDPDEEFPAIFRMDFTARNRRPPRDAVNALLSLAYSMLAKDLTIVSYAVGFDPMIGFYHQPRFGRPALALDLMEPFRPLVADSAVLSAINTRMITPADFVQVGGSVALRAEGRKAFFRAYELRMDTLVTHPMFAYRVSYRRMLEIQARLLGKMLQGEVGEYPVFVTR
jgi:CRISP-associated protein Cas1